MEVSCQTLSSTGSRCAGAFAFWVFGGVVCCVVSVEEILSGRISVASRSAAGTRCFQHLRLCWSSASGRALGRPEPPSVPYGSAGVFLGKPEALDRRESDHLRTVGLSL